MALSYSDHVSNLGEPIQLSRAAFEPDTSRSEQVCAFILSLALIFNDIRDVYIALILVGETVPENDAPTARAGQAGGVMAHLFRLLIGILHELLVMIDANRAVLEDESFTMILARIDPRARASWQKIASIPKGSRSSDAFARLLYWARNQVSFHYDAAAILRGYRSAFIDPGRTVWLSRGQNMAATRFYFADAAADAYIRQGAEMQIPVLSDFLLGKAPILQQVSHALRSVVLSFIDSNETALPREPAT